MQACHHLLQTYIPVREVRHLHKNNVVLTPHIASATWEARIQMARMSAENVIDVLIDKKPPRYLVNKELVKDTVNSII